MACTLCKPGTTNQAGSECITQNPYPAQLRYRWQRHGFFCIELSSVHGGKQRTITSVERPHTAKNSKETLCLPLYVVDCGFLCIELSSL